MGMMLRRSPHLSLLLRQNIRFGADVSTIFEMIAAFFDQPPDDLGEERMRGADELFAAAGALLELTPPPV